MLIALHITSAAEVKIRGGALVESKGEVRLVKDIVVLKINMSETLDYEKKVSNVREQIKREIESSEGEGVIVELLKQIDEKLKVLTERNSRKERSLLPFIGNAMNTMFGVATEAQVEKERERLDKLERWATEHGQLMSNLVDNVNQHTKILNNITHFLNMLSGKIENKLSLVDKVNWIQSMVLSADLIAQDIENKLRAFTLANKGLVTPELVSPRDVQEILRYSIINFMFHPVVEDSFMYYSLMTAKVVNKQVFVLIPFNSKESANLLYIVPFPMKMDNVSVKVKMDKTYVVEQKKSNLVSLVEPTQFEKCVMMQEDKYVCNIENFYLTPISKFTCLNYIINGNKNLINKCNFENVNEEFAVTFLDDKVYLFTKDNTILTKTCKNEKENRIMIENVNFFPKDCDLKIVNKFYYTPGIFQTMKLNKTNEDGNFKVNVTAFKLPKIELERITLL